MRILKNNTPTKDIKEGDEVFVYTLFGREKMIIEKHPISDELRAMTIDGELIAWLNQDNNGYWCSNCCGMAKKICKVGIIE